MRRIVGTVLAFILLGMGVAFGQQTGELDALCARYASEYGEKVTNVKISPAMMSIVRMSMNRKERKLFNALKVKSMAIFTMQDVPVGVIQSFAEQAGKALSASSFTPIPLDEETSRTGMKMYCTVDGEIMSSVYVLVAGEDLCSLFSMFGEMTEASLESYFEEFGQAE